jgi:hypothetical protein
MKNIKLNDDLNDGNDGSDGSNDCLDIGLTVDFRTYKEYFRRFNEKYGCDVLEFFILEKDFDEGSHGFHAKLQEILEFVKLNNILHVSFHTPDRLIESALFEGEFDAESDAEKGHGLSAGTGAIGTIEADKKKLLMLLDELKSFADKLGRDVIMVFHQGIKQSSGLIDSMSHDELKALRARVLKKAKKSYDWVIDYASGSRLKPMLENSPPSCSSDSNYHFTDLSFEDMEQRLGSRGFVFDFSHAAMCVAYYRQDKVKFPALEILRGKNNDPPESLRSMEAYVKKAAKNIRQIHINDANGILGVNEGLAVGAKGSIIDFKKIIKIIKAEIKQPKGVLEIVNSHKDYSLNDASMQQLMKISDGIDNKL